VDARAADWFTHATTHWSGWPIEDLVAAKGDCRVSVVIPARDEQATIAGVVNGIREVLVERYAVVDELVVMDSDSTDGTARVAADSGAAVHATRDVRPDLGSFAGKGEAVWKSLFVTTGQVLVFIDADLTEWGPHFVSGLLGPLLNRPEVALVKGFYDRVLDDGSPGQAPQGGRVTELVARPLLNLGWPELAAVVQPLAGEWAVRRSAMEQLAVPVGYGVEIATLLDVWRTAGLAALAQVDLGERAHSHQSVHDLGVMAAEILHTVARRAGVPVPMTADAELLQFVRHTAPPWRSRRVPLTERPPAATVDGYRRSGSGTGAAPC
jgi:glucosyl-3-phosphoglycerate synthase